MSQRSEGSHNKILVIVGYIGHGLWRNNSMHTFNTDKRILDIENCLRTCAQMPNVYVLGFFDSCRQDMGSDKRVGSNVKLGPSTKLITVYREMPNQARPCSCDSLTMQKSFVDYLLEFKKQRCGNLNLAQAVKLYSSEELYSMTGWDELEITTSALVNHKVVQNIVGYDSNWVNVEDNDDLNTSNESYISSSSEEDQVERQSFGSLKRPKKELTREERALVSRRFELYFNKVKLSPDEYWRRGKRDYDNRQWLKIEFDG